MYLCMYIYIERDIDIDIDIMYYIYYIHYMYICKNVAKNIIKSTCGQLLYDCTLKVL